MHAFTTPSPEPSVSPLTDIDVQDISNWWDAVEGRFVGFAVVAGLALVVWLVGRAAIKAVSRGVEHGTPGKDPRARRMLRKARINVDKLDTMELRLEAERRRQRAGTLSRVLTSALAAVIMVTLVLTLMAVFGVPVGPMLASAGIVGVALGFGAQSLVRDVLAGIFILIEDQYGVGDVVDLGAASGSVEAVGLRTTRLRALDGTAWYIPNGEITSVGNMTRTWSRAMVEVRFVYDTDVEAARAAMIDAVDAAKLANEQVADAILSEPEVAGIETLEFNAVMLRLLCQVNPATQWTVQREVLLHMRRIFAERGLRLAVPGEAIMVDTHDDDEPEQSAPIAEGTGETS